MKTIINDTCEVLLRRISDDKVVFTGEAQIASIQQSVSEERLRGGISSRTIAILRSNKEISASLTNAVFDSEFLAMISGADFASATNNVFAKEENLTVVDDTGTKVTIVGSPITGSIIKVIASDGTQADGTFAAGVVSFTNASIVAGDIVSCIYQKEVTGNTLTISADVFSENYYCEYHTIEYDIDTNTIVNDLYWIFNRVTPSGNFDLNFENGSAISPKIDFMILTQAASNQIGKVLEIPRT